MADLVQQGRYALSQLGYNFGLPGLGISENPGTPYSAARTPSQVYNTSSTPYQYSGSNSNLTPGYSTSPITTASNLPGVVTSPTTKTLSGSTSPSGGSGGGGGSSTSSGPTKYTQDQALKMGLDINTLRSMGLLADSGPSGQDLQNQVDQAYGEANGIYDQMYNNAVNNKQNYIDSLTSGYDALRPDIQSGYDTGVNQINQQRGQNDLQAANAIDAAKQQYQELVSGNRNRFGANSAGEFANAFTGRQYQQNVGQAQQTQGQNSQALNSKLTDLTTNYNANIQKLNYQKATAIQQAQQAFQDRLDQINQMKGQLAQNKAQLKLQALQELRQRSYDLQDAFTNYQRQLTAQHAAAIDQLKTAVATSQAYSRQPVDLAQFSGPQFSQAFSNPYVPDYSNISGYYDPRRQELQA